MRRVVAVAVIAASHATPARADGWSLGARIAPQWIFLEGDGPPADLRGDVLGVDLSVPVARRMAVAVALDGSLYGERSDRLPPGSTASSIAAFAELQLDTAPDSDFSARIDIRTGMRWLALPLSSGPTDRFRAWEPLFVRAGPAWRTSRHTQLAVMAGIGFGWLVSRQRDGACSVTGSCADSLYDSESQTSAHIVCELALTFRGWP